MPELLPSIATGPGAHRLAAALAAALIVSGCGGAASGPVAAAAGRARALATDATDAASSTGTTREDAFRLLTQATFGPTEADIQHVMSIGPAAWIDEQLAIPVRAAHLARWNADNAVIPGGATPETVVSSFYQEALRSDDQLRQRLTFALSEILVVSTVDTGLEGSKSQSAASYLDTLAGHAFGTYRSLLGAVALHPAMGQYLNAVANQKEYPAIGRIPDQNFAREVMQLFSIGLVQLNPDGSARPGPIATYGPADIVGLSRVFTGLSWYGPDTSSARFFNQPGAQAPQRLYTPMQAYGQFHSVSTKSFLGTTLPANPVPDTMGDVGRALDTLAAHPNVGPFVCRELIQRLVTSNPSPQYIARVAAVFADDGQGVRGNLAAVARAILLDREARVPWRVSADTYGKLREPVLRLSAFLRAYGATSDSGEYLIYNTDDPATGLSQSPLRAPSVFNFFRPGYMPAGGPAQQHALVLPEMQITDETSVAGYVDFMTSALQSGVGAPGLTGTASRRDVQPDFTAALALAGDPAALVADTTGRLLGGFADAALTSQIVQAVTSIAVPPLRPDGSNQAQVDRALRNRVNAAVLLTLASPEFMVQK